MLQDLDFIDAPFHLYSNNRIEPSRRSQYLENYKWNNTVNKTNNKIQPLRLIFYLKSNFTFPLNKGFTRTIG